MRIAARAHIIPEVAMLRLLTLALLTIPLSLSAADPATPLAKQDVAFLQKAAVYNLAEVKAAEIALARTLTPDERVYVETLKRQHAQAADELKALAKQKGVAISDALPSDMQEELAELGRYQDAEFNEAFLEERIDCHQRALRYLDDVRSDSADADLRRFAENGQVVVRQHLETARKLEAQY